MRSLASPLPTVLENADMPCDRCTGHTTVLTKNDRPDEFRLHLRAAFNNGVTRDEIREVLMHCAIYAGVPAANSAFHWAEDLFAQMDAPG